MKNKIKSSMKIALSAALMLLGVFNFNNVAAIVATQTLTGVQITTQPTNLIYHVGDNTTPDTTGMVLTGTYSQIIDADGDLGTTTAPITSGFTTSLLDTSASAATTQTVTITYLTKTTTYTVLVNPAPSPTPVPTSGGGGGGGGSFVSKTCKVADINCDGSIEELDFSIMMSQWGQTGSALTADLNHDGIVDELDFSILMANWGL